MKEESNKLPKAARYARMLAIALWPFGIVLGLALSRGQDAAGATLGLAMGIAFAAIASAFFGLVYWFCRSDARIRLVSRYRHSLVAIVAMSLVALGVWYAQPLFGAQQYSVRVTNWSSKDLVEVEIQVAKITVPIGRVQAGAAISREGLTKRPSGAVTVSWVDDEGNKQTVTVQSIGGPPRRYNGGELRVNVHSRYSVDTYFSLSS